MTTADWSWKVQGVILVILGVLIAVTTFTAQARDDRVKNCLADKVNALSAASTKRGDLVTQETEATKKVLLAVPKLKSQEDFAKILRQYKITVDHIQAERLNHPVPP